MSYTSFSPLVQLPAQTGRSLAISSSRALERATELRRNLYALFSVYGKVLDVVHTRSPKTRGTAFVVFRDLASSTSALRGLDGEGFFGKQLVSWWCWAGLGIGGVYRAGSRDEASLL